MHRGKFIPLNAYIKKEGKSQINNLSPYLRTQSKINSKQIEERKNKDKSRNQWIENRKTIEKINKKSRFFKRSIKLANFWQLTKKQKEGTDYQYQEQNRRHN